MISEEMLKKRRLKQSRRSGTLSLLQQPVSMNFPHHFKERCVAPFAKQNIL